jgi:hypothetical protein
MNNMSTKMLIPRNLLAAIDILAKLGQMVSDQSGQQTADNDNPGKVTISVVEHQISERGMVRPRKFARTQIPKLKEIRRQQYHRRRCAS